MRPALIITGAAKRVGAHFARHFARAGYDIALHHHQSDTEARALKTELEALGARVLLLRHDLAHPAQFPMSRVKAELPRCIGLINNASIFEREPFAALSEARLDAHLSINLKTPLLLTQQFADIFGAGTVIQMLDTNISKPQFSHFAYLLSKKALAQSIPMLAAALGPQVRVHGLSPGFMLPSGEHDATYGARLAEKLPLRATPSLDALARAAEFLLTAESTTGQILTIDGGQGLL